MKRKLTTIIVFFSYCFCFTSYAQITLLDSFNPSGASSVCGIGYDPDASQVWIYGCNASEIQSYTTTGVLLNSFSAPGGTANDVDIEIAPNPLLINGNPIPQGQLLFINGESNAAEIYAINSASGVVIETLNTNFGDSHVVGGSYHPIRSTFFMIQDNVPSSTLENLIAEIDPLNGNTIQTFQITNFFSVSYGDIEVGANGNLFVVSSAEDLSIAEFTPQGEFVQFHALPAGVSNLSGIAIDCASGEAWVSNTSGIVFHLGQFPGGSPSPIIIADGPTTFCSGSSVTLSVAGPGGFSYAWKKGSNFIAGATNPSYTVKQTGIYSLVVTNACGSVTSNEISVTVNPKPQANFTQAPCTGGAVKLTRTGTPSTGVTFKWKLNNATIPGATNPTYNATVTGSYQVEVTITATGCKKISAPKSVVVNCKMAALGVGFSAEAFPNPFIQSVTIIISSASTQLANVKLTDFSGRVVREYKNVDPSSLLDIDENLSPGVYLVQVSQGSSEQMIKVVKE